ncbi:nuclear transport factor 2 family protein [Silvibacterium dinghuense]|uniref:Nuclear transport factor 2 family protein n=1 Tax=Silvibacterium dinghuense TaxID=1560006 RepID=A0A4Q1SGS4_9BACT|nr:nuclear transport factor 2 family protein [Silvibacterium dinghuense]RXS96714.1 nuclear transport factor 2 family protein [Silvibacterium dinghuense]GGG93064.1 hypothetical protein GCM10011586_04740 [Silvibacterium dinghuense]
MKITPADIALAFIDMINLHDMSNFESLTTEDLLFIDAEGNRMHGRKPLQRCMRAYFTWFPDYSIEVEQSFASGNLAVITGLAMGTHATGGRADKDQRWRTPSAWQAVVRSGRISEWRIYADNRFLWQVAESRNNRMMWDGTPSSDAYSLLPPR